MAESWGAVQMVDTGTGGGGTVTTLGAQGDAHKGVYNHAGIGAFNYPINYGPGDDFISFRFVPAYTGTLSQAWFYTKTAAGYGAGTGGTLRVHIKTDNAGVPETTLVSETFGVVGRQTASLQNYANLSVALTAGTAYHLFFENADATPGTNYFSINTMHVRKIVGENESNVTTNPSFPGGMTRHGLDPRTVNVVWPGTGAGDFGVPEDADGSTIPAYWLIFSGGYAEGQPYYNASASAFAIPTIRTYTVPYNCVAQSILMHGSGRASAGGVAFNVNATVKVNGVTKASNIGLSGTHNVVANMGIGDLSLIAGDIVEITVTNTTNVSAPYIDAAVMTQTGLPRNFLPICLIGTGTTGDPPPPPPPDPPPPTGTIKVQGVSGRSSGHQNSAVKAASTRLLYRFIARETGTLNQFWVPNKMSGMAGIAIPENYEGYASGDGGTVQAICYTVDATSGYPNNGQGGRPTAQVGITDSFKIGWSVTGGGISSYTTNNGAYTASFGARNLFNEATRRNVAHGTYFKCNAPVTKGVEYAIEIRNSSGSPPGNTASSNFFSINFGGHTPQLAAQGANTRDMNAVGYYGLDPRENVGWSTNSGSSFVIPGGQYDPQNEFHVGFLQVYASGNRYVGRTDYGPGGGTGAGVQWLQRFLGSHTFTAVKWFPQDSSGTGGTISVQRYTSGDVAIGSAVTAPSVSGSGAPVSSTLSSSITVLTGEKIRISFPSQCGVASNDALGIPDGAGLTTTNAPFYAEGNSLLRYQRAIWLTPMPPDSVWLP